MNKTLFLPLKKEWYNMIDSGEKKEEYREINQYWINRICSTERPSEYECKRFKNVHFSLGYPKKDNKERNMTFEITDITIGIGRPEWGAPNDKEVFIIKLGRRVA